MKLLYLIIGAVVAPLAVASDEDSWLRRPPTTITTRHEIPTTAIFGVPASLTAIAQELLADKPVVVLQRGYLTQMNFHCSEGTHPYLVRALYEHGSTGIFHVYSHGQTLWVLHEALGPIAEKHRSALVVCLDSQPAEVFVSVGGGV